VADGLDFLGLFVGDVGFEGFLKLHNQLDLVEAVGVEVIRKVHFTGDLALVVPHLLSDDLDDLGFNLLLGHDRSPLCLWEALSAQALAGLMNSGGPSTRGRLYAASYPCQA